MGLTDKLEDKAQELKGHAKQAAGGATGDRELQAEGFKDEKAGEIKQVGEKVKDVFR